MLEESLSEYPVETTFEVIVSIIILSAFAFNDGLLYQISQWSKITKRQ